MKKILIIVSLLPFLLNGQTDTVFSKKKEILTINQNGINNLVNKYKEILKNKGGIDGWKIQITFKAKREKILPIKNKFTNLYPKIPAQITFESPYYKLIVGSFRTRNEALKTQHKINKHFPGAHPVPIIINTSLLK